MKITKKEVTKTTLSPFNDKKWITCDGEDYEALSFGHYKIEKDSDLIDCLTELANNAILD